MAFISAPVIWAHLSQVHPDVIASASLQKAGSCWSQWGGISDVMPDRCWVESTGGGGWGERASWGPTLRRHCRFVLSHVRLVELTWFPPLVL